MSFLDLSDQLCDAVHCPAEIGNVLVYMDDNHLTASYAATMAPATRPLTAPTLFGLLAEATRPPTAGPASCGADPRHHGPAAQEIGTWQDRAPPAITDR